MCDESKIYCHRKVKSLFNKRTLCDKGPRVLCDVNIILYNIKKTRVLESSYNCNIFFNDSFLMFFA